MIGCLRGCLGKLMGMILLVGAAYAGWRWGPAVFPRVQEWMGMSPLPLSVDPAPTPELADSVLVRVQALREEGGGAELALGGRELTSVLRYSVPGLIPPGVSDPEVELRDGRLHLKARVLLEAFPDLPDLGPILGMLPDTVDVTLEASLMPFSAEEAALMVHGVEASRVPLPRRLIPDILRGMGRVERPGLPPEALTVPLPVGLGSAYLRTDSLILSREP
jgi:hypothetical protein